MLFVPRSVKACDSYDDHLWDLKCRATIYQPGEWECSECGAIETFKWSYCGIDSSHVNLYRCYDIEEHTLVYKSSTKITVKIKKSSYGKAVSIKLYYKGKVVGRDECDVSMPYSFYNIYNHVLYAKRVKMGMTKKQVIYTVGWGRPDDQIVDSNGWSRWFYDDGAIIWFYHGKVKGWDL